jgi:hypothetical protein
LYLALHAVVVRLWSRRLDTRDIELLVLQDELEILRGRLCSRSSTLLIGRRRQPVGCTNAIFLQAADSAPTGITAASDG